MESSDQLYGYATVLLAAAPLTTQIAMANIKWTIFFPIFAIPALTLLISVGHLSRLAPVQTFRRMAPIASGIGWALTWHIAEKLYTESLRASQLFLYIFYSFNPTMSWAVSCSHTYNSNYCVDIDDSNATTSTEGYHYPDNFWPAQEFNRYWVRGNPTLEKMPAVWEPNEWYLGSSKDEFYFSTPNITLFIVHLITWSFIFTVLVKFYDRIGDILTKVFILAPLMLYVATAMGMTVSGFHFVDKKVIRVIDESKINEDPIDFWADLKGAFRTSLLIVDYSTAFTGVIFFATSRLRSGIGSLSAFVLVPMMMVVPTIQTILRSGCEGHVSDIQPAYSIYASTDETISFDLLPVCFATSHFGAIWSISYFLAQYLYTSLGPMLIYTAFIYQSFIDDMPTVQNIPRRFIGLLCLAFTVPSIFLYMPLGTKITALFRYTSQSSIVQLLAYIVIFFVYGWQRIEQDVLMTSSTPSNPSILEYFLRPTSPVFSLAMFTVVPMLICSKFVAVFDFLQSGNDVAKHIAAGVQFMPLPNYLSCLIGYGIMFAPFIIVVVFGVYTIFDMRYRHHLPLIDVIRPTGDWMSHASVNMSKPRPHSLAYGMFNSFIRLQYSTVLFALFFFESFIGLTLIVLFFLNSSSIIGLSTSRVANDYRSCMLLVFVVLHIFSLFELRRSQQNGVEPARISFYIGLATIEMAMMNAYMWMFASNHNWGTDLPPFSLMLLNTWIRGVCILAAIAVRAHMLEQQRPSRARDASEIYDSDMQQVDAEDESPSRRVFPLWVSIWLVVSALICTLDVIYTMFRPYTNAKDGFISNTLFYGWKLYSSVDIRYANTKDEVTCATGRVMLIEIVLNLVAVFLALRRSRHALLVAFTTSAFVFWKTFWYLVMYIRPPVGSPPAFTDQYGYLGMTLIFWIPNCVWVVLPFCVMVALWNKLALPVEYSEQYHNRYEKPPGLYTP
ncbi:unnamed protein product [Caenorhabditis bovis]|uniref:EXPERA domain-containing protein n=1 Tax=Caenorhabditis bovis TaxID=2654633 RepID=A0A8S1FEJ8_9PELO|nr:unnamed protein product [Caenorhabditis bovis]